MTTRNGTAKGQGNAPMAEQASFEDGEVGEDAEPAAYQVYYSIHTYCSVCGHDWTAGLQIPPSQQNFLECPDCRCWTRMNLIDYDLRQ